MDTLLTIAQDVIDAVGGMNRPSTIIGQTTRDALRLQSLMKRSARRLILEDWPELLRVGSISVVASTTMYDEPSDLHHIRSDTLWTSNDDQAVGQIESTLFEALFQQGIVTIDPIHRLRQTDDSTNFRRQLEVYPTPSSNYTLFFLYQSNAWCQNNAQDTRQSAWTADNDFPIVEDEILSLAVTWRLLRSLRRDYAEEFNDYQTYFDRRMGQSQVARTINVVNRRVRPPAQTPEIGFG